MKKPFVSLAWLACTAWARRRSAGSAGGVYGGDGDDDDDENSFVRLSRQKLIRMRPRVVLLTWSGIRLVSVLKARRER